MTGSTTVRRGRRPARARKTAPQPVSVGPGERLWLLDPPFRMTLPGTRFDRARKAWAYVGIELPVELEPFRSAPYSRLRWLEDEANGCPGPGPSGVVPKVPRPIQTSGAEMIAAAAADGWRQFLLCDDVGTGKTITMWLGALAVARPAGRILVLVDRPAAITIPHWRTTIAAIGDGGHRVLISSPDQLPKLLSRNGRPAVRWDVVIADECHLYRHTTTRRTEVFRRVARFNDPHCGAPFVIAASATPAQHPAELTYLAPVISQLRGETTAQWADFGGKLADAGLPIVRGKYGAWVWSERAAADPQVKQESIGEVRGWLTDNDPPLTVNRPAPWGAVPLDLMPVELDPAERAAYFTLWKQFRAAIAALLAASTSDGRQSSAGIATRGRAAGATAVREGRAAALRFRQKASVLRVQPTVDWVVRQLDDGLQVAVSCEFLGAAAVPIATALEAKGVAVARIHGSGDGPVLDLERERLRFQSGAAPVVVFTPSTSLSLHAGEQLADGAFASPARRVGVMHNVRYSGLAGRQILGRTHRDHQVSPWWVSYAEGTVEERIAQTMIERFKATSDTAGADSQALTTVAALLGVSWLPPDALGGD
jgi:hypothetical protein